MSISREQRDPSCVKVGEDPRGEELPSKVPGNLPQTLWLQHELGLLLGELVFSSIIYFFMDI